MAPFERSRYNIHLLKFHHFYQLPVATSSPCCIPHWSINTSELSPPGQSFYKPKEVPGETRGVNGGMISTQPGFNGLSLHGSFGHRFRAPKRFRSKKYFKFRFILPQQKNRPKFLFETSTAPTDFCMLAFGFWSFVSAMDFPLHQKIGILKPLMFVNDMGYVLLHDLRRSWTLIPDEGLQAFQVL